MLETIAIILVLMWLLGMVSSYTIGGYIHLLLLIALIVVILRLIRGRNPLR
ncbi:MAG: lmo0937 family membrane protein [Opitutaceae bacterium]|nr:lmo0937 family membrane protein [Opitutaceae bacterium]